MDLFSGTISNLDKALNYSATKQKVISQNIANVDRQIIKLRMFLLKLHLMRL